MNIGPSEIISAIALIASIYSIRKTVIFNRRQVEFIETNDNLNRLLIEKERSGREDTKKADVAANFANVGKNTKLKVFNKGKAPAKNVRFECLESTELFSEHEISELFPIDIMEPFQNIDLYAYTHMSSPRKAKVKLQWDDESGKDNERIMTVVINY